MFSVHPNSEPSEWFKKKKYMYEYMREREREEVRKGENITKTIKYKQLANLGKGYMCSLYYALNFSVSLKFFKTESWG